MKEGSKVDFKEKPVPYNNSPKKQIEILIYNSKPQKIVFKTKTDPKLKPKFIFSKIQKD